MSCECAQCRQHYRTLGIAFGIPEESVIEESYRESVKQWHPDLYENYASLRADAEEHFKKIQVAYRELKEHNAVSIEEPAIDNPVISAAEPQAQSPVNPPQKHAEPPSISFGDSSGCLTADQFTPEIEAMVSGHLGKLGAPLAIVDLSGSRSRAGDFSHFLLLATRGVLMRDSSNLISVLWYTDMGEVQLIDQNKHSKPSAWQKFVGGISGNSPGYMLTIYRSNGTLFGSILGQVDDHAKTVLYDLLTRKKAETRS